MRARYSAVLGLLQALLIPFIHLSVYLVTAMHPMPILLKPDKPSLPSEMLVTLLSSILAVQRSFGVEQPERALDGLLISPISREAIYLGKAIANMCFVGAIQLVAIPAATLFYSLPVEALPVLFAITALATVGLVAVGTLFASMAVNTRLAELLLPMLSLPFFMPIVIAAGITTQRLLAGRPFSESLPWLRMLIAFDLVFLTACTLAFPHTIEE